MTRPADPRPHPRAMIVAPQPDAVEAGWSVLHAGDRPAIGGLAVGENLRRRDPRCYASDDDEQRIWRTGWQLSPVSVALPIDSQLGALRTALSSDIPPSSPA